MIGEVSSFDAIISGKELRKLGHVIQDREEEGMRRILKLMRDDRLTELSKP